MRVGTLAIFILVPFSSSSAVVCAQHLRPAGGGLRRTFSWVEQEHLTLSVCQFAVEHTPPPQIFYTMWCQLWTLLTQCSSLPASLKIGTRNTWQITGHIMLTGGDLLLCRCCLFMKPEVKTPFLRCKVGKAPHKALALDRIPHRQFPTEMPVIRSHVESGVAMESICF